MDIILDLEMAITCFQKKGEPIGYFSGEELFGFDGKYLGEIMSNDRLIVNKNKKYSRGACIAKPCKTLGRSYCDYVGYVMYAGYEDFEIK